MTRNELADKIEAAEGPSRECCTCADYTEASDCEKNCTYALLRAGGDA